MKLTIPNFFIIGAPKAGTTALQKMLSTHSDVFMSPIKEPHYFSTDFNIEEFKSDYRHNNPCDLSSYLKQPLLEEIHLAHTPNWEQYIQLFREAKEQKAIGEASSGYLYSTAAPKNIYNTNSDARVIMILRSPVDRAYSHYCMDKASGRVRTNSFVTAVENDFRNPSKAWGGKHLYVELGLYYEHVRNYLDIFPQKQVKVIFYDDWVQDNKKIIDEVCSFLEILPASYQGVGMTFNKSKSPRFHYLHHFITLTRLRELQRIILPSVISRSLKKVWYSTTPREKLTINDRQKISKFFVKDKDKLRSLLSKPDLWL